MKFEFNGENYDTENLWDLAELMKYKSENIKAHMPPEVFKSVYDVLCGFIDVENAYYYSEV